MGLIFLNKILRDTVCYEHVCPEAFIKIPPIVYKFNRGDQFQIYNLSFFNNHLLLFEYYCDWRTRKFKGFSHFIFNKKSIWFFYRLRIIAEKCKSRIG